jgi:hypothetical protein
MGVAGMTITIKIKGRSRGAAFYLYGDDGDYLAASEGRVSRVPLA